MRKEEVLSSLVAAGFNLIELKGKIPIVTNWTNEQKKIDIKTTKNVGVVLTDTDIVIDIDPRNFIEGENAVDKLKRFFDIGKKVDTFQVKTGSNGLHIYLKKPKGIKIKKKIKGFSGIDFLSKGHQVVAPSSIHPITKKEYVIAAGTPFKIIDIPVGLLQVIKQNDTDSNSKPISSKYFKYDDSDTNINRYKTYLLKAPVAIENQNGDDTTYKTACMGKDFGLSAAATFKVLWETWNLKCLPPWDYEDLAIKVGNAYKYTKTEQKFFTNELTGGLDVEKKFIWDINKKTNTFKNKLINIVNILSGYDNMLNDLFRYNSFSHRVEYQRIPPWKSEKNNINLNNEITDYDFIELRHYLTSKFQGFEPPTNLVLDAVKYVAKRSEYHPVKNYLNALVWDGVKRLETWLIDYAGVEDNKYTREVSKKIIVAAIARIYNPGCKFDNIIVLEGEQGTRKSTLCSILGGKWFADLTLDLKSKDIVELLSSKWIVEVSEMEVTKKSDAQSLKAFLSRSVDRVRLPYARLSEDFPRSSIFIGTINPTGSGYLKDATGNRRFWVVKTEGLINTEKIKLIRDNLFAEAIQEYKNGCELYLTDPETIAIAEIEVEKRRINDPFFDKISNYINTEKIKETSISEVALGALSILGWKDITPLIQDRIATCLLRLNFKKETELGTGRIIYKLKDI